MTTAAFEAERQRWIAQAHGYGRRVTTLQAEVERLERERDDLLEALHAGRAGQCGPAEDESVTPTAGHGGASHDRPQRPKVGSEVRARRQDQAGADAGGAHVEVGGQR